MPSYGSPSSFFYTHHHNDSFVLRSLRLWWFVILFQCRGRSEKDFIYTTKTLSQRTDSLFQNTFGYTPRRNLQCRFQRLTMQVAPSFSALFCSSTLSSSSQRPHPPDNFVTKLQHANHVPTHFLRSGAPIVQSLLPDLRVRQCFFLVFPCRVRWTSLRLFRDTLNSLLFFAQCCLCVRLRDFFMKGSID